MLPSALGAREALVSTEVSAFWTTSSARTAHLSLLPASGFSRWAFAGSADWHRTAMCRHSARLARSRLGHRLAIGRAHCGLAIGRAHCGAASGDACSVTLGRSDGCGNSDGPASSKREFISPKGAESVIAMTGENKHKKITIILE